MLAETIENNPKTKSFDDLPTCKMGAIAFGAFKIKATYQQKKFVEALTKARDEISSYAEALGITGE